MARNMIVRLGVDASSFLQKMIKAGVTAESTGQKIKKSLTADQRSSMTAQLEKMKATYQAIRNATEKEDIDLSRSLTKQIDDAEKAYHGLLEEAQKTKETLRAALNSSGAKGSEQNVAALRNDLNVLRASANEAGWELGRLKRIAGEIGPENINFASHTGMKKLESDINQLEIALSEAGDEARQTDSFIRRIGDSAGRSDMSLSRMVRTIRNVSVVSFGLRIVNGLFGELGTVVRNYISQDAQLQAQVNGLSASMGNALAPAIHLVAGALSYVLPYVVGVSNAIGQLMAMLTGKGWSAASSGAGKVATATGGAAKAQKELNRQLLSFDQINRMESQKDTGGGGGGGGAGSALEEIVAKTPAWMERFKASFTDLFNSTEFQAANIGGKIGMALQTGLDWLGGEGMRFDWRGVGTKLRENFNSFMSSGWLSSFFYDIGVGIGGLSEFVSGLFDENIDWGNMYETFTATVLSPLTSGLADFFKEKGNESAASFWEGVTQWVSGKASTAVGGLALLPIMPIIEAREDFKDQMNKTGKYSMEGFGEGMSNEITASDWKKFFSDFVAGVKRLLGINSPSTVFSEIGENCMAGLGNGFTSGLVWIQEKLDELRDRVHTTASTLRDAFSFEWRLPHLRLPHLQVNWDPVDNVLAQFFGVSAFPRLNVDWYAKGFITNGTSILNGIGIGERGREALLPLDSNDGWKDEIAQRIAMILQGNNGGDVNATINVVLDGDVITSYVMKGLRRRSRAGTSSI